jgi:hypothetical protein
LYNYHKELLNRIGSEAFEKLEKQSKGVHKHDKEELKEIIKEYKKKCKEIENND